MRINEDTQVRERMKTDNLQDVIKSIVAEPGHARHLVPVEKLLLTNNDSVAKHAVKSLQRSIYQY